MFRSGLFDKSSTVNESSPGRNNICNRFPVGITTLGEDNQNIRIQLAVHKYNSSSNSSPHNKHSLISPIRHSISKKSPKANNYEYEVDSTFKSENKCGNQYEGVGNFPLIHLEKSSVLYRPIKRFNRRGISYPEIPENRFLNHMPQLCSDPKPNTRSVLDVLQDLSRKRIHSKSETNHYKKKLQGLGGDDATNGEVAYKPLFIKKDKTLPISVKDGTTQTILPYCSDKSFIPCTMSSLLKNDASDPKAELRKRLAKQNNEIFASLSSSVSPIFSLKRKIDKISKGKSDIGCEILTSKKPKLLDKQKNDCEENGTLINVSINGMETHTIDFSPKTNFKNKLKSGNASSPNATNKDRLTTIFLDMQNESAKAQIFKNSTTSIENKHLLENNESNAHNLNKSLAQRNTCVEEAGDKQNDGTLTKENLSVEQSDTTEPERNQNSNLLVNTFQYPLGKSNDLISNGIETKTNSSSSMHNTFGSSNFNFNSSIKSDGTPQNILPASQNPTTVCKLSDQNNKAGEASPIIKEKSGTSNKESITKPFGNNSESEVNKPDSCTFKFGFCDNSLANNIPQPINIDTKYINPISTATNSPNKSNALPFSFGIKNSMPTTTSINSLPTVPISSNLLNSSDAITIPPENIKFTIGKPPNDQNSLGNFNKPKDETERNKNNLSITMSTTISQNFPITSSLFGQKSDKTYFVFGKGKETESSINNVDAGQSKTENIQVQIPTSSQSTNTDSLKEGSLAPFRSTNVPVMTETSNATVTNQSKPLSQTTASLTDNKQNNENTLFCDSSDQKFTNPTLSNNAPDKPNNYVSMEQKKQSSFSFNFLQNSETQSKGNLEQNIQPNLFSFGQKSKEELSKNDNFDSSSNVIQTPVFDQKSSNSVIESNLNSVIALGQNNSKNRDGTEQFNQLPSNQTKNSNTKISGSFVNKNETVPFGSVFGQNSSSLSSKTPIFGTSNSKPLSDANFVVPSNQPTAIFGISSTTSSTEFKPTTSTAFGIASTGFVSRSNNSFGVTTTAQPSSSFGATAITQPTFTFGTSSTTQGNFIATTTAQSTNTFGLSAISHPSNIFGSSANQINNVFGVSNTQPSNGFGSNTTKVTNTFGTSATTQSGSGFSTASSSPFEQSFAQNTIKTVIAPGQSSVSVFGQNTCVSNTASNAFNLPTNSSFNSSTSNNVFGNKSNNEQGSIFGQVLKGQTSSFIQTPVSQNFNVGMSTSSITGFTSSPNTTTSVFTFGASSQGSTFNFGNNLSTSTGSTSSPFVFNSPSSDSFKLGVSSSKESSGFGGNSTSTFTFGAPMNNTPMVIKPTETAFNFGTTQPTSTPAFNFSSHSASPVFSFGSSGSNTGSSSTFNFGAPQNGGSFGQATPSPVPTFSAPGTFSIGSGSSQSRQRASSRLRRRP